MKNNELSKKDIEETLEIHRGYKDCQQSQKRRGLNDFNIFTALLSKSDEVRLHSRFIHTLLNPSGSHSQDSLFLGMFLQECGLGNMGIDVDACRVLKEYRNIDLYITDDNMHIIIENKIYAGDREEQIESYIEVIKKENIDNPDLTKKLIVVYLSLNGSETLPSSLGKFKLVNDKLVYGDEEYLFKAITYNKEILNWIDKSKEQVSNITNLSVGLKQYKEVLLKLYNQYVGSLMTLTEYIASNGGNSISILKNIKEISSEYISLREQWINDFFVLVKDGLDSQVPQGWEVQINVKKLSNTGGFPLKIMQAGKPKVLFGFEFNTKNYHDPFYGLVRINNSVDLNLCFSNNEISELLSNISVPFKNPVKTCNEKSWWFGWEWYCRGDLFDFILNEGGVEKSSEKFCKKLIKAFNNQKSIIEKCNEILGAEIKNAR